jgi:hypothetical protein
VRHASRWLLTVIVCLGVFAPAARALDFEALVENLTPAQAARYERFRDGWTIRGVCGTRDLDLANTFGVNTVRGYTIKLDGETKATLDEAHALGMKVIVSEWMPHQGANKGKGNSTWNFDYTKRIDERLAKFTGKVDAIGDHPAILMWGLGNEVHLDREYLEYVNLMSKAIHERHPLALTSLTMINAKPDNIEKIKRFAPDLDVVGVQSYSVGAVRGGIRNMERHWGKPYYYSEFNGKGPWNFKKTAWGIAYDDLPAGRAAEIDACYDAIEAAPRCLGSTAFVWGQFNAQRPSYFSLLLSPHPDGPAAAEKAGLSNGTPGDPLVTPHAEVLGKRFTGSHPIGNHAPLITALETLGGAREASVAPGGELTVRVAGTDADGDALRFTLWLIDKRTGRYTARSGPFAVEAAATGGGWSGTGTITAPGKARADTLVLAYAFDDEGGAVCTTIPVNIEDE